MALRSAYGEPSASPRRCLPLREEGPSVIARDPVVPRPARGVSWSRLNGEPSGGLDLSFIRVQARGDTAVSYPWADNQGCDRNESRWCTRRRAAG
uniref:Uncharacterized protein n=1 Tax=Patollo virus TaxID=2800935 RepID=A0A894KCK6_9VIRU|nr:MAG: hypothetical protein [Patollo virus]